jgi:hypothetical protein
MCYGVEVVVVKWFLVGFWCRGLRFLVYGKVVFLVFLVVWRCKGFWCRDFGVVERVLVVGMGMFWCGEGLYL